MSHRSSRTTFQTRLLIVGRHRSGWPQAHIAAAMGISRKCVKTWLDRYAEQVEAGLEDRLSRPPSVLAGAGPPPHAAPVDAGPDDLATDPLRYTP